MAARRSRLAGNRVNADPFLCSICKSGSARIEGEQVSVRWLEAFANFANASGHQVRFASGLFSALTGARDESRWRGSPTASEDEDEHQEQDFLDFVESDAGGSTLLCGNSRKFLAINLLLLLGLLIFDMVLDEAGIFETSYIVMFTIMVLLVYSASVASYVFIKYQRVAILQRFQA